MARTFTLNTGNHLALGANSLAALMSGASKIALSVRYKFTTVTGAERLISTAMGGGITGPSLFISSTNKLTLGSRSSGADGFQSKVGTTALTTGTWYTLGGLIDIAGDTITPYVNGVAEGGGSVTFAATTYTPGTPTDTDRLGANLGTISDTSLQANGVMAEVGVWSFGASDTLTAADFDALADGYSPLCVRPDALAFFMPLIGHGGSAGPERDLVGGLTGTITGTLAIADHPRIIYPKRRQAPFTDAGGGGATASRLVGASSLIGNTVLVGGSALVH